MKFKKLIILSLLTLVVAAAGVSLGVYMGLQDNPNENPGLITSNGKKMSWNDLVTNKVVTLEDNVVKGVDNTKVTEMWPEETTFDLEIPEDAGITEIGFDAFNECMKLTSIKIPSSVTYINTDAFYNCDNLTTVTFANDSNLKEIGYGAFTYCEKLVNITIPSSVTRIDESAFIGCSSLMTINIPAGVSVIESHTFKDCISLSTLTIDGTITRIDAYAFYNCLSLTNIDILLTNVEVIKESAFVRCDGLVEVNFSSLLNAIETDAFMDCQNLKNVTFASSNVTFGTGVFRNCINLLNINLPSNTDKISDYMFYNCEDLETFTVGENVKQIGYRAFMNCYKLNVTFEKKDWLYSDNKNFASYEQITFDSTNSNKIIEELSDCYFAMKSNNIVVSSLDKTYDGAAVDYPTITTSDGYNGKADPSVVVNEQNIEVVWYYYDSSNQLVEMNEGEFPTEVGKYKVEIIYPETIDYLAKEVSIDFEISPILIELSIVDTEHKYDSLEKIPGILFSVNNNIITLPSTDYAYVYFVKNDEGVYEDINALENAPTEVGQYVVRIKLIGEALKHYTISGSSEFEFSITAVEEDLEEIE